MRGGVAARANATATSATMAVSRRASGSSASIRTVGDESRTSGSCRSLPGGTILCATAGSAQSTKKSSRTSHLHREVSRQARCRLRGDRRRDSPYSRGVKTIPWAPQASSSGDASRTEPALRHRDTVSPSGRRHAAPADRSPCSGGTRAVGRRSCVCRRRCLGRPRGTMAKGALGLVPYAGGVMLRGGP